MTNGLDKFDVDTFFFFTKIQLLDISLKFKFDLAFFLINLKVLYCILYCYIGTQR